MSKIYVLGPHLYSVRFRNQVDASLYMSSVAIGAKPPKGLSVSPCRLEGKSIISNEEYNTAPFELAYVVNQTS